MPDCLTLLNDRLILCVLLCKAFDLKLGNDVIAKDMHAVYMNVEICRIIHVCDGLASA